MPVGNPDWNRLEPHVDVRFLENDGVLIKFCVCRLYMYHILNRDHTGAPDFPLATDAHTVTTDEAETLGVRWENL